MTQSSWDDVINYAELEYFVGREHEQDIFRRQLKASPPHYVIYYITGQAGVGKTTLLTRYRQIASEIGYIIADCDEQQKDVPTILGRFAHQFSEQGFPLKRFSERYEVYYQRMHEIENDPEAPQGLAALIGKTLVRAAFVGGDILPGIRKGLEFLPRESIETQASEWAGYLAKKLRSKDEITLLRDPISILTPLFFEGLNEITEKRQVLLCFDNFHATRQALEEWLLHLREYKPSINIRIAIASQDLPGARWDTLRKVTLTIHLDTFTQQEAEAFLDAYSITDTERRREILEFSDRLPVLMSWLSAPEGQDADPTVPTHDVVERFLRWIPEMSLRQVALIAAIPHTFNLDILRILLNDSGQSVSVLSAFDWLLTMPFVQQRSDSWQYHNVVRRMLLRYQRQKSPQDYKYLHHILASFYNARRKEIKSSIGKEWTHEEWRKCTLAYIYHFLVVDSSQHWSEILDVFIIALRRRRTFAVEIIELLNSDDVRDELSREQNDLIKILKEQLQNISSGSIENGFEMFDRLVKVAGLNSQAKSIIFGYRAEAYRLIGRYEEALADFNRAITLNSDYAWAFASRGETYRLLERYEEALADFNHAITLNNDYVWAFAHRGETYRLLERYEEALADFERAIDLDKETCAFVHRADMYRGMRQYKEALVDYDRAILREQPAKAFSHRGDLYRALGRYEEALADFERAIDLDKETCAFLHRADLYRKMRRYKEALVDYDRAVTIKENPARAFSHRGETYRALGRYEEALADFERAIDLDKETCAFVHRADLYRKMRRYKEALVDYNRAILGEESATAFSHRGETYRALGRYEEALADFERAIDLDKETCAFLHRADLYRMLGRYEKALADYDRAVTLDQVPTWAFAHRGETYRVLGRYREALVDYDRAVTLGEDHYTTKGLLLSYLGRYKEAIENYEVDLRKEPSSVSSLYNIAVAMFKWKGLPDAQVHIDRARHVLLSSLDTDMRGSALYGLGGLEALAGNFEQAIDYFEQAAYLTKSVNDWVQHDIAWADMRSNNERFRNLILGK